MEIIDFLKKHQYHIFVAFNLLWIWALLSPNIYYFDDNYRAAGGYYNWGGDFRPFADYLYYILGMGRNFTDLTPLPQLFALVFLYSIYFLYIKKFNAGKINIPILLVFLPIVWSPFLLANLYFRYDSIFMLLAVLLSVLAVFYVDKKQYIRAGLLLFVACGFYQPAIVAYVCTTLFIVYTLQAESKNGLFQLWLKKSFIYFLVFLGGVATYYFTIMKFTTEYNSYSSTHNQMLISNIVPNLISSLKKVGIIFQGDTGFVFAALFFYLIVFNLFFLIKKFSYFGIVIFLFVHTIFAMSAAGVNLLLDIPQFEYRTFIFLGFYISYLLLSAKFLLKQDSSKKYLYSILLFTCFYFLSIALNTSNAQKEKNSLEKILLTEVVRNFNNYNLNMRKKIVFYGEINTRIIQIIIDKYPIIYGIAEGNIYYGFEIQNYYEHMLNIPRFRYRADKHLFILKHGKEFSVIHDDIFYTIYESSSTLLVCFKLQNLEEKSCKSMIEGIL
ncbi:glucosyltransferase domain-containing protein [Acinetobacter indicus]|uniref:glucosyltransferase domain-containing protein n=1 Tax=Acinetobacter indicus TaxID=756892 RepID=UPI000CEC38A3|nr:glucosyltransferase domain-containing protein [Acinetobacter indicus]